MEFTVIVHNAEEGGYWAEVPSIPGCATEGETLEELTRNVGEAIAGCLGTFPPKTNNQQPMTKDND